MRSAVRSRSRLYSAAEKGPSAALGSSALPAAYFSVRLSRPPSPALHLDLFEPPQRVQEIMVCRPGKENDPNEVLRHSAAHVMASAVQKLFPGVKVTIGPVIENGFFYDFDSPHPFSPADLETIENKMQEIADQDLPFLREEVDREAAI